MGLLIELFVFILLAKAVNDALDGILVKIIVGVIWYWAVTTSYRRLLNREPTEVEFWVWSAWLLLAVSGFLFLAIESLQTWLEDRKRGPAEVPYGSILFTTTCGVFFIYTGWLISFASGEHSAMVEAAAIAQAKRDAAQARQHAIEALRPQPDPYALPKLDYKAQPDPVWGDAFEPATSGR